MLTLFWKELKTYGKTLLIWSLCVGGMGFVCILLYSSMETSMQDMAKSFSQLGSFAKAFGMDQLSIGTITGYYATEIGVMHGLGGAMFAAMIGTNMLSKEEDGHTSEFLFSLPISRTKAVGIKWCATFVLVIMFNIICVALYLLGFAILGEGISMKEYVLYHGMQLITQLEFAAISYGISAFMRKNKLGIGLGVVLIFYAYDLMLKVVSKLDTVKIVSPFSYSNAADIFHSGDIYVPGLLFGIGAIVIGVGVAASVYTRRDLST